MKTIIRNSARSVKKQSPLILTSMAISGVAGTAYFAARAAYDSRPVLEQEEYEEADLATKAKAVWRLYIPAGVTGVMTVSALVLSHRISARRTTAMAAAYTLTERALAEYREKVVEEIGEQRERAIRDKLADEKIANGESPTLFVAENKVLVCELRTRRYFESDMQQLKAARNEINARVVQSLYVTLDEFYDILGLEHTSESDVLGWDSEKLLELEITTAMTPDGRPCLAFEYNYLKPV